MKKHVLTVLLFVYSISSHATVYSYTDTIAPSLKTQFAKDFKIGAALNTEQILGKDPLSILLIPAQFNAITPENAMKSMNIHPEWNRYDFSIADKFIEYGKKNNQIVNGHTLIWHSQLSPFAGKIKDVDSFRIFFENHIQTVAGRYKGKIFSWDVVNEALEEDGSMRKSIFYQMLGENYVSEAFKLTANASPGAELYYNDYNIEQPAKRKGCIELIKKIQASGARIDGVGIQGHWHLGKVPFQEIENSIIAYASLGLKVMITELDIEMLPRNFQGADVNQLVASNPALNPYPNGITPTLLEQQASDYANLFKLFLKYKNNITRITFWGVHDGQSWLNGWPVRGRTNYPLLFDRKGKGKPAFEAIVRLK